LSGVGLGGGGKVGYVGDDGPPGGVLSADAIQAQIASMDPNGFGHVKDTRGHIPRGPQVRFPSELPSERVPASVIASVVRANAGRFHVCHGIGLRRNPTLAGRVQVAFTIDAKGQVTLAHDAGGALEDEDVRRCVVKAFFGLTFPPPPRGGTQNVTFPIVLGAPSE
jgi:hypothetical protein